MPSAAPFEYIPLDAPTPLPRPAYLYPLPSTYVPPARSWSAKGPALAGFILGLLSALFWFIPGLGLILPIVGFALSVTGWLSPERRWLAILGVALSTAALATCVYNSALGGYIFPH